MITGPIAKSPNSLRAFKISPSDTNYFACLADPVAEGVPFTFLVEIYEIGGATPPNTHTAAFEFFLILEGTGKAYCDGHEIDLAPGFSLLIPPRQEHILKNTGPGKLYALCAMVPNEAFAEMIHGGQPVELDAEDIAVLSRGARLTA